MNIEIPNKSNSVPYESSNKVNNETIEFSKAPSSSPISTASTQYNVDEATGILQAIVTDKLSEEVIRKIPADEYLQLLSLIDEMISGSIDKHV